MVMNGCSAVATIYGRRPLRTTQYGLMPTSHYRSTLRFLKPQGNHRKRKCVIEARLPADDFIDGSTPSSIGIHYARYRQRKHSEIHIPKAEKYLIEYLVRGGWRSSGIPPLTALAIDQMALKGSKRLCGFKAASRGAAGVPLRPAKSGPARSPDASLVWKSAHPRCARAPAFFDLLARVVTASSQLRRRGTDAQHSTLDRAGRTMAIRSILIVVVILRPQTRPHGH